MSTTEDRMVEYALNLSYDELPDQAIHQLKRRLIDTLGGALAAYTAPALCAKASIKALPALVVAN